NPFGFGLDDGPVRNCSPDFVQAQLADKSMDLLLMYDATPAVGALSGSAQVEACRPYNSTSPAQQWVDLRNRWKAVRKAALDPGRGFGFPFTADALVTALPADIKASFKACN